MIIHITTVHLRDDSRILSKQVRSIASAGRYKVELFVQDGEGDQIDSESGVLIRDTGPRKPRINRMIVGCFRMFLKVIKARPDIVHFHDPELLPWAVLMSLFGISMVYDVHEDYPKAIAQNYRLPKIARKILPSIVRFVEWVCTPFLRGIVAVTPEISARFPETKTILVRNYPILTEFRAAPYNISDTRRKEAIYVGTITENRNIIGMLDAVHLLEDYGMKLRLLGGFTVLADETRARRHIGWKNVIFDGWVSRENVVDALASASVGLVTIKPVYHEMAALPIKLFEYMAAEVPIISSDFPIWRKIIEDAECGIMVDPEKPKEIAEAIRWIFDHPSEARAMGKRGRKAIESKYNWHSEAELLYRLYERIIAK